MKENEIGKIIVDAALTVHRALGPGLLELAAEELKYLARCVELLRDQTETSCEKKMESFV